MYYIPEKVVPGQDEEDEDIQKAIQRSLETPVQSGGDSGTEQDAVPPRDSLACDIVNPDREAGMEDELDMFGRAALRMM